MSNEQTLIQWVRDNITAVTVASPAIDINTAYALPFDYAAIPTDAKTKWIGVWREPDFAQYSNTNLTKGFYDERFRVGIFVLFHYGELDIWSKEGLAAMQQGMEWRDGLVSWFGVNERLGGNAFRTGEGDAKFYIDPLTPSPPWTQIDGWGTYMVIPVHNLRD